MELSDATRAFAALSQPPRLTALRLLIEAGPEGLTAGALAEGLGMKANTLSANLSVLLGAGLVLNRREGRSVRYFAAMGQVSAVISYLMEECCGGRPELCRPAIAAATGEAA
ncbi:ArsR/SmtB family transcription factor [Pseudoroseicyclus sp. CXY001]|uniref:ArsR/SmtB family transcription factor n=1 Tax=Pseudoroseicyclus sp. CXY001 TaxID=3242492 RepID=UPI00358DD72B